MFAPTSLCPRLPSGSSMCACALILRHFLAKCCAMPSTLTRAWLHASSAARGSCSARLVHARACSPFGLGWQRWQRTTTTTIRAPPPSCMPLQPTALPHADCVLVILKHAQHLRGKRKWTCDVYACPIIPVASSLLSPPPAYRLCVFGYHARAKQWGQRCEEGNLSDCGQQCNDVEQAGLTDSAVGTALLLLPVLQPWRGCRRASG